MPVVSVLGGLVGGWLATVVRTVFMILPGDDSPPPTAALWSRYPGDQPLDVYMRRGMVLHMLYGIGAGAAFAVGVTALGPGVGVGPLTGSILWAVAYALVLTVVGAVFWMRVVLAMESEPAMVGMFAFFCIVYRAVLGTSVASIPL